MTIGLCRPAAHPRLAMLLALRDGFEHVVDRFRRVDDEHVRVLIALAGHARNESMVAALGRPLNVVQPLCPSTDGETV